MYDPYMFTAVKNRSILDGHIIVMNIFQVIALSSVVQMLIVKVGSASVIQILSGIHTMSVSLVNTLYTLFAI